MSLYHFHNFKAFYNYIWPVNDENSLLVLSPKTLKTTYFCALLQAFTDVFVNGYRKYVINEVFLRHFVIAAYYI